MSTAPGGDGQVSQWRVIVSAIGVTALGGMPAWLLSALAPRISQEYGFDSAGLGLALGAFFGISAVFGVLAGRIVDRIGWRFGVVISAMAAATACAGMAISPWLPLGMAVLILCGAFSNSACQPASNLGIAERVAPRRHGTALGVKQAALPIATFLVGISVPLFDAPGRWRLAFACIALIGFTLAVAMIPLRGTVRRLRKLRQRRSRHSTDRPVAAPRALRTLAIGAGFGTAATMSLGGFLVTYAVVQGYTPVQGGLLLAVGSAVGICARVVSGFVADRRQGKHFLVVSAMMVAGTLGVGLLAWGANLTVMILGTVLAYGLGWSWNGVFHFAVIRNIPVSAARATGVIQTTMSLGAMLGPASFGLLATTSYSWAWASCGAALLIGALFVLWGRQQLPT